MSLASKYRDTFGEEDYQKFFTALHSTSHKKGRLLFWQEQRLGRLYQEEGLAPLSVEELLAIFPYEEPRLPTLEELLPSYLAQIREQGVTEFSDKHEITRYVSKTGTLDSDFPLLTALEPHLRETDVLELYTAIRAGSRRCESEWRPGFCILFGRRLQAMPEPEWDFSSTASG